MSVRSKSNYHASDEPRSSTGRVLTWEQIGSDTRQWIPAAHSSVAQGKKIQGEESPGEPPSTETDFGGKSSMIATKKRLGGPKGLTYPANKITTYKLRIVLSTTCATAAVLRMTTSLVVHRCCNLIYLNPTSQQIGLGGASLQQFLEKPSLCSTVSIGLKNSLSR